ncbi:MAG: hypothetical protein ACK5ML_05625 [Lachnospiraceae bacterium]
MQNEAYDIADKMTEFFLIKEQEKTRKRKETARRYREQLQRGKRAFVLSILSAVFLSGGLSMIYLQMEIRDQGNQIEIVEQQLNIVKTENQESLKRTANVMNNFEVLEEAKSLGMQYAQQDDIVVYSIADIDYMVQTQDVPAY